MSQTRNAFFTAMNFFSEAQGYLSRLSVLRESSIYYIFLQKKHYLGNMISTELAFVVYFWSVQRHDTQTQQIHMQQILIELAHE